MENTLEQLNHMLNTMRQLDSAAKRGNWAWVKEKSLAIEQALAKLAREIDPQSLSAEEQAAFSSVREIHARILSLVATRQDKVKAELDQLMHSKKASKAYGDGNR